MVDVGVVGSILALVEVCGVVGDGVHGLGRELCGGGDMLGGSGAGVLSIVGDFGVLFDGMGCVWGDRALFTGGFDVMGATSDWCGLGGVQAGGV
jgi:hypothetical protein